MIPEVTINGMLYALAQIGDHVEAHTAYIALAALYPDFAASIKARFITDQIDWYKDDPAWNADWDRRVEEERLIYIPEYVRKGGVL